MAPAAVTVYLADDHVAIREMMARSLEIGLGFRVVGQSNDGRRVLDECRQLKPQLLVLDLGLPGLHGLEVARALTATHPDVQILVFSSQDDPATVRQALQAGARGMVEKTAPLETLLRAAQAVAAGKAYFGDVVTQALQQSFAQPVTTQSPDLLTTREREVLQLVAEGLTNKEIAARLGISVKTTENHRHHIMAKIGARNATDLTREAYRLGLIRSQT